ncbi:transpeptidase [Mycolicibacterium doricum]|uniref:Transpeptidase n=1 Tax=Mycolicibacterium doricum TaxID=126673 RepID=A0A1X1T147_9MYCO|nr:Ig-like domain-containing protein [Mycolicibacterium doricum]MCV7269329.1 L,D-transpeptidase family protein [Mycolicibacterium doricum]ORV38007.1 L,D-transpeptidase [Mycolicibacterium doricum]BBZ06167.1 transpeptidase [Mycolicibacterium doricum]
MTDADKLPPVNRRRALTALAVGLVAPGALAACSRSISNPGEPAQAPASASVAFEPATSATDVSPTDPVRVEVSGGWFQRVALKNAEGKVVAGALNQDRNVFTVSEPLGYGVTYSWSGSAVGEDGRAVPVKGEFTTLDPAIQVNGRFQLADGQTVGVAAPVILQFDASIGEEDRATVEKALSVATNPPTEGSWAWLPDEAAGSRLHWRSREYFEPGTTVRVDARFYGVKFGADAYGAADSSLDFTIGRRQVVKAEASSHRLRVEDASGATMMDIPCSYGEGDLDRNVTRSGIHVVTEKYEDFYMSNPAAGYYNLRERWSVRISNNGEFIHANPASLGAQGSSNVTNGCINLSLEDAEQYFHSAMYGDPVEVTGTRIQLSYADGDIWDWAMPWEEWKSMSALSEQNRPQLPSTVPATPSGAPQPVNGRPGG